MYERHVQWMTECQTRVTRGQARWIPSLAGVHGSFSTAAVTTRPDQPCRAEVTPPAPATSKATANNTASTNPTDRRRMAAHDRDRAGPLALTDCSQQQSAPANSSHSLALSSRYQLLLPVSPQSVRPSDLQTNLDGNPIVRCFCYRHRGIPET